MRIKVGDKVVRNMAGIKMDLQVTAITEYRIVCGPWEFDKATGAEVDEDLGWGPNGTGSKLERCGELLAVGPHDSKVRCNEFKGHGPEVHEMAVKALLGGKEKWMSFATNVTN